jgi:hypothetical protein
MGAAGVVRPALADSTDGASGCSKLRPLAVNRTTAIAPNNNRAMIGRIQPGLKLRDEMGKAFATFIPLRYTTSSKLQRVQ